MFVRLWLMVAAIITAGVGGSREDGVAAAAVLLVAFTVSLVASLLIRSLSRPGGSPPGSPSHA
jgi:hypothetical protein